MIRIQINLDRREYELVRKEARAHGMSVAEFVDKRFATSCLPPRGAPWIRYAGLVESGDPRSSQSVDAIVYG
jgi:hypothetical protein